MSKSKKEIIANSLLQSAGLYWNNENEDAVKPIDPEKYDPALARIFEANAVELEKLYSELEGLEQRVITRLSQTLVPDSSLLPLPAVTVAQLNTKFFRIEIRPEDNFTVSGQDDTGEQHTYYFTSLFDHKFPRCELKYLLSNASLLKFGDQIEEQKFSSFPATKHVWLGLDIGESVETDDQLIFFLGNKIVNEFDPDYAVFGSVNSRYKTTWQINGNENLELKVHKGIEHFIESADEQKSDTTTNLLNALRIPFSYENQIFTRFKDSFLTIKSIPENLDDFKSVLPPVEDLSNIDIPGNTPLLWIKISFQLPIPTSFFKKNRLYTNCIPLLNRRLIEKNVSKSDFDRILLPLSTQDHFLSINKIWDETDDTNYERLDILNPDDQQGSYVLRSSEGVRRFNRHDASLQINRLLDTIQEEHTSFKEGGVSRLKEDFTVINKAMNRIKRIMYDDYYKKGLRTSFFAIANFRPSALNIYYNYWETQGERLNHLKNKNNLEVRAMDIRGVKGVSIIPIQEGRGELKEEDYLSLLKESILSRNKIVTKGDIEQHLERYEQTFVLKNIERELIKNQNTRSYERVILVKLHLLENSPRSGEIKAFLTSRLQNELNALTTFFTPIKVDFE